MTRMTSTGASAGSTLLSAPQVTARSSDAAGRAASRDRLTGWLGPLAVMLFGGLLRFWQLGRPRHFVFDETYYAKDAWSLLHFGYERNYAPHANRLILAGHPRAWADGPAFVAHPPAGKWLIAAGEWAFGMNATGWRVATALAGTLSVLLVARIGRRLTGSTLLGCLAGLLLAVDGLSFVLSRVGLLDGLLAWWVLAAFGALVLDRDRVRDRLRPSRLGLRPRRLGLRPWRLLAGLCLGLACATKWNGVWFVAAFGGLSVLWDVGARRQAGEPRPVRRVLRSDAGPAFLSIVGTALVTYLASWAGWFATAGGWDRHWAVGRSGAWSWVPAPLRGLWHYHAEMLEFNTGLHAFHPYRSDPWGWLVLARPVSMAYDQPKAGCGTGHCVAAVLAMGTPLLWWGSVLALCWALWLLLGHADWRAGGILTGVAAGWLPWFAFQSRTAFSFYSVAFAPFLVLAVTLLLGAVVGPGRAPSPRRTLGAVAAGAYVLLVVANFAYLLPILDGQVIPYAAWLRRMWWPSWV